MAIMENLGLILIVVVVAAIIALAATTLIQVFMASVSNLSAIRTA